MSYRVIGIDGTDANPSPGVWAFDSLIQRLVTSIATGEKPIIKPGCWGLILDDHEMGIHAEARRESFALYSDFGKDWSIELPWDDLRELSYLVRKLEEAKRRGVWEPK